MQLSYLNHRFKLNSWICSHLNPFIPEKVESTHPTVNIPILIRCFFNQKGRGDFTTKSKGSTDTLSSLHSTG